MLLSNGEQNFFWRLFLLPHNYIRKEWKGVEWYNCTQESFGLTAEKLQRELDSMAATVEERNATVAQLERELQRANSTLSVCQVDIRNQQLSFEENVRRLQSERDDAVARLENVHASSVSVDILKQRDAQVNRAPGWKKRVVEPVFLRAGYGAPSGAECFETGLRGY